MKSIYLLIGFLVLSVLSYAQAPISILFQNLRESKSDSQKIDAYRAMIRHYAVEQPDSANYYAEEGIEFARKKKYILGEAKIVSQLGIIDQSQGRIDLSRKRIGRALNLYRQINNMLGVADMSSNMGVLEGGTGNYDVALKYFVTAMKIHDSLKDYKGIMITGSNIASIYLGHEDIANAEKYLNISEDASYKTPVIDQTIALYNTIGVVQIAKGDTLKGLQTFLKDLKLSDRPGFMTSHAECYLYLGNYYLDKGMPDSALIYLEEGLNVATKAHITEMQSNILLELATISRETNPAKAMDYLKQARAIADSTSNRSFLLPVLGEMASIYKQQGNYKDALEVTELRKKIADSVFNISKMRELAGTGAAYQFETDERIKELEVLSKRNALQRDVIIAVAVSIVIVLVVMIFYYRKTRKLNRQLIIHERELEEINSMKDKLFSVIGHDLRGPIARIPAIIDIYTDDRTNEEEKQFLLDSLREHTKASLETFDKLLYWGQSLMKGISIYQVRMQPKISIRESIELRKMKAAEKQITIKDTTPEDLYVYADAAHFDFIVRNLLANALKYTYPKGLIEINADKKMKPGFTVFSVKDNGVGIPKDVLPKIFTALKSGEGTANEKGNGIGLMLCKEFAMKNGGDIWVESEEGKGATFSFSVKNAD